MFISVFFTYSTSLARNNQVVCLFGWAKKFSEVKTEDLRCFFEFQTQTNALTNAQTNATRTRYALTPKAPTFAFVFGDLKEMDKAA